MTEMFEMLVYRNKREANCVGGIMKEHFDFALTFLDTCLEADIVKFRFYRL